MRQRLFIVWCLLVVALVVSCKKKRKAKTSFLQPQYDISFLPDSVQTDKNYAYLGGVALENIWLNEASGLACGKAVSNVFWSHNDSGDPPRIFAFGAHGEDYATCYLEGIHHKDYEDICLGSLQGIPYIFVADIGDNLNKREKVKIYQFLEPKIDTTLRETSISIEASQIKTWTLNFPDGARDAESIMFDPIDASLYIISKREEMVGVYQVLDQPENNLELVAQLPLTWVVAADISGDGKNISIKTGEEIWNWKRRNKEPLGEVLQSTPLKLPYEKEKQGEAFAWDNFGNYYTIGEGSFLSSTLLQKYRFVGQ